MCVQDGYGEVPLSIQTIRRSSVMSPAPPSRKERENRERKNGKRVDSSEDGKFMWRWKLIADLPSLDKKINIKI